MEHMSLEAWLEERGIKKGWFAKKIGVTATHFSKILNGSTKPSLDLALDIEDITLGVVRPRDLVGRTKTSW